MVTIRHGERNQKKKKVRECTANLQRLDTKRQAVRKRLGRALKDQLLKHARQPEQRVWPRRQCMQANKVALQAEATT